MSAPAKLLENGRVITSGEGGNLLMVPVVGACGDANLGPCPLPIGKVNAQYLRYTQKTRGNGLMAIVLVPFQGEKVPQVNVKLLDPQQDGRQVTPFETTALEIEIDGQKDYYVDQHMHWNLPWKAGPCEGAARLFHSRATRDEQAK